MTDAQHEFLTVAQTAALLQVSRATVRRWLEEGTITGLRISREWRVHRPRLLAALQVNEPDGSCYPQEPHGPREPVSDTRPELLVGADRVGVLGGRG